MQGKNPPQNCNQAFSKDGDQIFTNRNYAAEQTRSNYLSGDVEEEIRCVCVCSCSETHFTWQTSLCKNVTSGYLWSPRVSLNGWKWQLPWCIHYGGCQGKLILLYLERQFIDDELVLLQLLRYTDSTCNNRETFKAVLLSSILISSLSLSLCFRLSWFLSFLSGTCRGRWRTRKLRRLASSNRWKS